MRVINRVPNPKNERENRQSKAGRYKIIPGRTSNLLKKNVKNKVDDLVRIVEYMCDKFGITEEIQEMLDRIN